MLVRKKQKSDTEANPRKPQIDYLSDEYQTKGSPLTWIKYPVYFCSGIVGMFLLYRSYGLFQIAFNKFGLTTINSGCSTLDRIPLIGSGLSIGCFEIANLIVGSIALITLLTLSILQLIPTLLYFHPNSIKKMVHQLRSNRRITQKLEIYSDDSSEIKGLVKRHNSLSDRALRTLLVFSVLAFCVEAGIIWVARGGRADVGSVLIDSLALDLLVVATLAFGNAFHAKPQKVRIYGE